MGKNRLRSTAPIRYRRLKVDGRGRVWVTGFRSGEITILAPGGVVEGALRLPDGGATNLWFAGPGGRSLYVTCVTPVPVSEPGEIKAVEKGRSTLYCGHGETAGLALKQPQFRLG